NLAMQFSTPGSWRLLNNFAGSDPGIRLFLSGVPLPYMHFENELHETSRRLSVESGLAARLRGG
ncbi:MAG: hypothetical protein KAG87_01610, partial [Marinobacter adhaerens]|nr:hypothetical protein [Marinobacter adhaerens]